MAFFFLLLWNMLCGIWSEGKNDPAVRKKNQQRVRVVIKMFFVMGIAWIAEIVSFFLTWAVGNDAVYREVFFFQIINSLQVSEKGLLTNCINRAFILHLLVVPGTDLFLPIINVFIVFKF